jgi:hypothetical protein
MSDRGAPASTRAADTARVRGVALGWAKVAVSMTIPAISAVARAPSPASSGTPSRTASSAVISHVAAAADRPSPRPPGVVGGMVVDDRPRQIAEQLRVLAGDRADALGGRAVGQDQQVVGDGGIGIGADALDVGHERVDRRRLIGEHRGRAPADGLTRRHSARSRRACPRPGSRGRRPTPRVRVEGEPPPSSGTAAAASATRSTAWVILGESRACRIRACRRACRGRTCPSPTRRCPAWSDGPSTAGFRCGPTAHHAAAATASARPGPRRRRRPARRCRPRAAGGGPVSGASP